MQLNIEEIDSLQDNNLYDDILNNENIQLELGYEQIPENIIPIKVIKKGVHFYESEQKPINKPIPKVNAKMVRQQIQPLKPKISYEDILSKMGMLVSDGKLHLIDRTQKNEEILKKQYEQPKQQTQENNYIYNKFFKDELQQHDTVRKPRTLQEYKMMVIKDYIQRQKIKQIKSTKLIMPTTNINISGNFTGLQNKLFNFSKR
jgi:hypothetical protein